MVKYFLLSEAAPTGKNAKACLIYINKVESASFMTINLLLHSIQTEKTLNFMFF